ncbi:MAG: hypothetical protein A2Y72_00845 [Chloroflexi bacterium RBG_13_53_26]|nr:MAG: hypothetical protein A2Y72_00845 [Chloroflexi bacterium RBG_13_53_26]
MDRIVKKGLPGFGIALEGAARFVVSTLVPLVREMRQVINARFGEVVNVTDDYTITNKDEVVIAESAGGAIAITLPPVIGWTKHIIVKRIGGSNVTVSPSAEDLANGILIDAAASVTIATDTYANTFISNGSNWYLVTQV